MAITVGAAITERLVVGTVVDNRVGRKTQPSEDTADDWRGVPAEVLLATVAGQIVTLVEGRSVDAVGLALPGMIRDGVVLDSAILPQLKGGNLEGLLRSALQARGIETKHVRVLNDADAIAAGIAAQRGVPEKRVRVWLLSDGVGLGCYPSNGGLWEGGHIVVSLDPSEKYCGCGGRGHLEGIVGARAMRLRFFDLEPEEVFSAAFNGDDSRCSEFIVLWHRALAAATATSLHMNGPGVYCLAGPFAKYANVGLLHRFTEEMVTLTSLQGYGFELISDTDDAAIIGAAASAAN